MRLSWEIRLSFRTVLVDSFNLLFGVTVFLVNMEPRPAATARTLPRDAGLVPHGARSRLSSAVIDNVAIHAARPRGSLGTSRDGIGQTRTDAPLPTTAIHCPSGENAM